MHHSLPPICMPGGDLEDSSVRHKTNPSYAPRSYSRCFFGRVDCSRCNKELLQSSLHARSCAFIQLHSGANFSFLTHRQPPVRVTVQRIEGQLGSTKHPMRNTAASFGTGLGLHATVGINAMAFRLDELMADSWFSIRQACPASPCY